ncbi:transketolase [Zongyangia hominis]|uniref:Transketolase n=1 Tax=Zongyangia hominis TaxID=2763677 RepID=A0A926EC37_9FIRM|nr:transketolase [Zongyangia hominis]MBC8569629.1 transketolase [Zongyangia hominis]
MEMKLQTQLEKTACQIRIHAVEAVHAAKSGHPGGSLSIADILACLYFNKMRLDPKNPKWEDRDRFVLSKGHCAPAVYAALALKGYFPVEELLKLRQPGAMLQGHPDMKGTPGIDMSTGSLGQGFSAACGMAAAGKAAEKDYRVYSILGDGETQEGQIWEAAMFAANYKLDNLCAIVDCNGLQIDGNVAYSNSPASLQEKFTSFGFAVEMIDAHDLDAIMQALDTAEQTKGKPTAIIAKSIKGKGVSFMENNGAWHGAAPNDEQFKQAMEELHAVLNKLEVE